MDSAELVRRWRKRQWEILKKRLFPEDLAEYRKLARLIKEVRSEQVEKRQEPKIERLFPEPKRIPLSQHREKLIAFLKEKGPATRIQIAYATGIPEGSLSSLLKGREFEQVKRGFWGLKRGK
jgi:hypothetical protein